VNPLRVRDVGGAPHAISLAALPRPAQLSGQLDAVLGGNYFNDHTLHMEPFVEPWRCQLQLQPARLPAWGLSPLLCAPKGGLGAVSGETRGVNTAVRSKLRSARMQMCMRARWSAMRCLQRGTIVVLSLVFAVCQRAGCGNGGDTCGFHCSPLLPLPPSPPPRATSALRHLDIVLASTYPLNINATAPFVETLSATALAIAQDSALRAARHRHATAAAAASARRSGRRSAKSRAGGPQPRPCAGGSECCAGTDGEGRGNSEPGRAENACKRGAAVTPNGPVRLQSGRKEESCPHDL